MKRVRFDGSEAATMENAVFLDVTPCGSCKKCKIRFGKHIASMFRVPQCDRTLQLCYCGINEHWPPHRVIQCKVEEHCRLGCYHGGKQ
jgi:hypothetical protein